MLLVPCPRRFYDVFQLGILRFPAEFVERLVRRGHQLGRIAGTTRFSIAGIFLPVIFSHIEMTSFTE